MQKLKLESEGPTEPVPHVVDSGARDFDQARKALGIGGLRDQSGVLATRAQLVVIIPAYRRRHREHTHGCTHQDFLQIRNRIWKPQ